MHCTLTTMLSVTKVFWHVLWKTLSTSYCWLCENKRYCIFFKFFSEIYPLLYCYHAWSKRVHHFVVCTFFGPSVTRWSRLNMYILFVEWKSTCGNKSEKNCTNNLKSERRATLIDTNLHRLRHAMALHFTCDFDAYGPAFMDTRKEMTNFTLRFGANKFVMN